MHGILFVADVEKLDCEESELENAEMILKVADYSELFYCVILMFCYKLFESIQNREKTKLLCKLNKTKILFKYIPFQNCACKLFCVT